MELSIVVVNWNVREDLLRCLGSIKENPPSLPFEVIVVDNASSDGSVDAVKAAFPEVTVIANDENRGFAAANNQGIEKSKGRYILSLNPDTIVHRVSLDRLVEFMEDNGDMGAVGPKLLNTDGSVQPSARGFPTFRGALYRHTVFRLLRIFRRQYKEWLMKDFGHNRQMDVEQLMGSALMVRRSVMEKLGGMDESFFMYYEEVDLCLRIKQAGWRIVFMPQAAVTHLGGHSAEQVPVEKRVMMLKSLLGFFRKHRGKFSTGLFNCVFKPAVILRDICNIASNTVVYIWAVAVLNKRKRQKSAMKIRHSAVFLAKYWWWLLFKM